MEKTDFVEAKLKEMFYYDQLCDELTLKMQSILHDMINVKSPNLTSIHGVPEDRQHRLIRLGQEKDNLELQRDSYELKKRKIKEWLHLQTLDDYDIKILEYYYKKGFTYEAIAYELGYSSKQVVQRKVQGQDGILKKLADGVRI